MVASDVLNLTLYISAALVSGTKRDAGVRYAVRQQSEWGAICQTSALVARFSKSNHIVNSRENLASFGFSKRLFGRGLQSGSQTISLRTQPPLLLTPSFLLRLP